MLDRTPPEDDLLSCDLSSSRSLHIELAETRGIIDELEEQLALLQRKYDVAVTAWQAVGAAARSVRIDLELSALIGEGPECESLGIVKALIKTIEVIRDVAINDYPSDESVSV